MNCQNGRDAPLNYPPTDDPARANLILLNTCSVRDKAEQKMMSQLGRLAPLKEYNDDLVLGVAGGSAGCGFGDGLRESERAQVQGQEQLRQPERCARREEG